MDKISFAQWIIGTMIAVAVGGMVPLMVGMLWVRGKISEFQTTLEFHGRDLMDGTKKFDKLESSVDDHGRQLVDHQLRLRTLERVG